MVSAHRGWGTQRANPGAPAMQRLCLSTLRGPCTQWATTGPPDAFRGATSARRGSDTQGANPGGPATQWHCSSAPRGSSTQWATAGAPEAPCGKEARQEKEPPKKWVGRTKADGAVMVQRKSPGTPCGAGHVGLTHTEPQRGRLWMA